MKNKIYYSFFILCSCLLFISWSWFKKDPPLAKIKSEITTFRSTDQEWPNEIEIDKEKFKLKYSFNKKLEKYVKKQIKRYRPDYVSMVILDNKTGRVLLALDYTKKSKEFGHHITLSSTHPAASLFKIISAVDFLKKEGITLDKEFLFRGKRSTLYKGQLKEPKGRWIRKTNLKKAFSRSNNVIFGRTAQNYSNGKSLYGTALKMGIEHDILQLLPLSSPQVMSAGNPYQLAELASGFNRKTLISPMHAAVISQIIANDGLLRKPYIVSEIEDKEEIVYNNKVVALQRIPKELAKKVKAMMIHTVDRGTASSIFRRRSKVLRKLSIGGKTGTITGGIPLGKRDWFSCFAIPKDGTGGGISMSVMMINVDKWFVRSTQLAKTIMNYYFKEIEGK